jgi:hypothetical protein
MVLNIVTDEPTIILERLRSTLGNSPNAPKFLIKGKPAKKIVEILVYSENPYACISLEQLHEALWPLHDFDIRIIL